MKHGAQIFCYNRFNWKDPGTYMSWFVRSVLSLDNYNLGNAPVHYNHTANIVENTEGDLYVIEAGWNKVKNRPIVISTPLHEWITKRPVGSFLIKYPTFAFDAQEYSKVMFDQVGKWYGLWDVIVAQQIRVYSWKKLWIGTKNIKTHFCSKLSAYGYFAVTGRFKNYLTIDPEELFNEPDFVIYLEN